MRVLEAWPRDARAPTVLMLIPRDPSNGGADAEARGLVGSALKEQWEQAWAAADGGVASGSQRPVNFDALLARVGSVVAFPAAIGNPSEVWSEALRTDACLAAATGQQREASAAAYHSSHLFVTFSLILILGLLAALCRGRSGPEPVAHVAQVASATQMAAPAANDVMVDGPAAAEEGVAVGGLAASAAEDLQPAKAGKRRGRGKTPNRAASSNAPDVRLRRAGRR
jgi:hypothetical protein